MFKHHSQLAAAQESLATLLRLEGRGFGLQADVAPVGYWRNPWEKKSSSTELGGKPA